MKVLIKICASVIVFCSCAEAKFTYESEASKSFSVFMTDQLEKNQSEPEDWLLNFEPALLAKVGSNLLLKLSYGGGYDNLLNVLGNKKNRLHLHYSFSCKILV